ncbi:MAG: hypothetical protein AB1513_11355 [Pseudomonadota bacterium]
MRDVLKRWRRSKTMIFAALLAGASAAQASLGLLELTPKQMGYAGIVLAAAVAVLRKLTRKPLEEK